MAKTFEKMLYQAKIRSFEIRSTTMYIFPPFLNLLYVHDVSNSAYFVHIRRRIECNWCVQRLVFKQKENQPYYLRVPGTGYEYALSCN